MFIPEWKLYRKGPGSGPGAGGPWWICSIRHGGAPFCTQGGEELLHQTVGY